MPGSRTGSQHAPTTSDIRFVRLHEIDTASLSRLLNDPIVLRHMPLSEGTMSEADIREWVRTKEGYWHDYGFGPWGILIGGTFAGWGGLQPWDEEVEIALVLRPEYWGWGRVIFQRFIASAFGDLHLTCVFAPVPPTRGRARGLLRLGFSYVRDEVIDGRLFMVYRLDAPTPRSANT